MVIFQDRCCMVLLVVSLSILTGWTRPYKPEEQHETASPKSALGHVAIKVNGKKHIIRESQELAVVFGDQIEVVGASTLDGTSSIDRINVIGFLSKSWPRDEDRNISIDSAYDLVPKWSENGKGEVYAVSAMSGKVLHGSVYVRIVKPVLNHAVVAINGISRTVHDGETLTLAPDDKIKVQDILTNLKTKDDIDVKMVKDPLAAQMLSGVPGDDGAHVDSFRIVFERKQLAFGSINVLIKKARD